MFCLKEFIYYFLYVDEWDLIEDDNFIFNLLKNFKRFIKILMLEVVISCYFDFFFKIFCGK